ncbi:P-type DNA transfer ATPase VirB11 [Pontixanthobacter aestiaquae]|uniref:P-type DNA transfer ATPase VirB11 n=1 Tax=Pontixanthobacter aestiaquae TaxID=1509367 RepID=A0A844Z8W4_9SPHN|nr:P-type DNA transfer ATPase VirB11 [Pontixanthobacter aestiaquae]MDN3644628.1 P-type DNA transfer ATPase VirB11 [Pontixanthobacter aestiaquae]MXO84365.1 P-type DNA transfer ATPase VirB11 [Pontixanthobacter aestiaquae]
MEAGYYLDSFLAPLAPVLARDDVTDIFINRPCEVWIESIGGGITVETIETLNEQMLGRLSRQIAAANSQGINRNQPLLSASLPDGSRVQIIAPPATRAGHAIAIRRHVASNMSLKDWGDGEAFLQLEAGKAAIDRERTYQTLGGTEAVEFLRSAVVNRRNILISGGTSTGKTTFLNGLLAEIPANERLILIEDTEELKLAHRNAVGMIAARGQMGEADVSAEDLLIAALRMRPDRIILGELRGSEAFTFLRAVNTGHPGSVTTIHADTPQRAIEQLALLVLQTGSRLSRDDVRHYVRESIDVFVQLERREGKRRVSQILAAE